MAITNADALVDALKDNEELRSILYYSADDREVLYVRDDVNEQYSAAEEKEIFDHLWMTAFGSIAEENVYVLGEPKCLVTYFETAVMLNFVIEDDEGVAVSFDADAFPDQQSFVNDCYDLLAT